MLQKPKVVVILGATATGKSHCAIEIAKQFQGEIISGDSMLVYKNMNIGTAKPTAEELAAVPHHLVDILPPDESDPAVSATTIIHELEKYNPELAAKPRWLVFNKLDLVLEEEADAIIERVVREMAWEGPVYRISAFDKQGTDPICYDILKLLESMPKPSELAAQQPERVEFKWDDYHKEQLAQVAEEDADDDDDDWDEDDYDVEVIYTR